MGDEFDDMLDAAMDDVGGDEFDDFLDAAADDLVNEISAPVPAARPAPVAAMTRASPANANKPRTWQDALQILPVSERVRWATTIARDVEKQRLEEKRRTEADGGNGALSFSNFSNEYQAGYGQERKPAPEQGAESHFAKLCHKAGLDKSLSEFEGQYLSQLKADYVWRVADASLTDEADVRAQPERFPHLIKLIDSAAK